MSRGYTLRPIPLDRARLLADQVLRFVTPYCERVEFAGALARGEPLVTFIDLVVLQRTTCGPDTSGLNITRLQLDEALCRAKRTEIERAVEFPSLIDGYNHENCYLFRKLALLFEPPVRAPVRIVRAPGADILGGLLALACADAAELKRLRAAARKQSRVITPTGTLMSPRNFMQKSFFSTVEFYDQLRLEPPRWFVDGPANQTREQRSSHGHI